MALGAACRLVPQTNAVLASYTMSRNNLSSSIAHNFAKDLTTLSATKKLASGQAVKAVYGMKDKTALVELAQAPFTARPCFSHAPHSQHACKKLVAPARLHPMLGLEPVVSRMGCAPAFPSALRLAALQLVSERLLLVLQLSVRTKLRGNKPSKPTLGLTISRDVEYKQVFPHCPLHFWHTATPEAVLPCGLTY